MRPDRNAYRLRCRRCHADHRPVRCPVCASVRGQARGLWDRWRRRGELPETGGQDGPEGVTA